MTRTTTGNKLNPRHLVLVVLALLLIAGTGAAYYFRQRAHNQQKNTSQDETSQPSEEEDKAVIAGNLDQAKQRLVQTADLPATEKATRYSRAAILAARLDDPAAKDYAAEALKLYPVNDASFKADNADYDDFLTILTEISKGNYKSAKGAAAQ